MSVKINIIKTIEKKKLTYRDLKPGAFFFLKSLGHTEENLRLLGSNNSYIFVKSGVVVNNISKYYEDEVILVDVVIDIQVKEN